jgi:pantothenate kinase
MASVEANAARVAAAIAALGLPRGRRLIAAIAGPPGSGKSTLAEAVCAALNTPGERAAVLPMDGYHYDDAILNARGERARKGAPHTFDVDGYRAMLVRLRGEPDNEIAVPVFDRDLEISRGSARLIAPETRIIVTEGNYLLLDADPWTGLAPLFDMTIFIREPEDVLRSRLEARWVHYKYTPAEMDAKMEGNDMPNVRVVLARSVIADLEVGG